MNDYKNSEDYYEDRKEKWRDYPTEYERCQYCENKTQFGLYEAEYDGKTVWICEDCLEHEFTDECEVCELPIHPDYLWKDHRCLKHTTKLDIFIQKLRNKIYLIKRKLKNK